MLDLFEVRKPIAFPERNNRTGGKDEWLTPPDILSALGDFDLDPCAPVVRPWDTAKNHYTELDNGLSLEWAGRVFLNPPYSDAGAWLSRLASHGNGIALVFARTDTRWFHSCIWEKADALLFLRGRIKFFHVDGSEAKGNCGAPSVLIAFAHSNVVALQQSSLSGAFIDLSKCRRG